MHDVRVALDAVEGRHRDAAGLGHAPDVVAGEVDEHGVLGELLLVGQQVGLELRGPSAGSAERGRVPAMGRVETTPSRTRTSSSGEAPSIERPGPRSTANRCGDGLMRRSER